MVPIGGRNATPFPTEIEEYPLVHGLGAAV
jgi:hypothetical protein